MKSFIYAMAALLVAACALDYSNKTFDKETGNQTGEETLRIVLQPVEVRAGGTQVKIGEGTSPQAPDQPFEVYDNNGDGMPDLVKLRKTGRWYRIVSMELIATNPVPEPGRRVSGVRQYRCIIDGFGNEPTTPIKERSEFSAEELHKAYGWDSITQDGDYTMPNVLIYEFIPYHSLASSYVRLAVRTSTDWKTVHPSAVPGLKYEMLCAEPEVSTSPAVMVTHVEGTFIDVVRWMVLNGTRKWWSKKLLDAQVGVPIGFVVQPGEDGSEYAYLYVDNRVVDTVRVR